MLAPLLTLRDASEHATVMVRGPHTEARACPRDRMVDSPTQPNATKKRTKRDTAAILLAEDELSDEVIAKTVGVNRTTLHRWKQEPAFAALVGDYRGAIIAQSLRLPIAKKHKRIETLNELHEAALSVMYARRERYAVELAASDAVSDTRRILGDVTPEEALSGLMVREESVNATGMKTVNWKYDAALARDIKDTEKQAAQELGQWEETLNVNHGGVLQQEYVIIEDVPWADAPDGDE